MKRFRIVLTCILLMAMLCSLPASVKAETSINAGYIPEEILPEDFDSAAAVAYGLAPDHLYPFVYSGQNPGKDMEMDASDCKIGALYVYNSTSDTIAAIYDGTVTAHASTKDHLFFVT